MPTAGGGGWPEANRSNVPWNSLHDAVFYPFTHIRSTQLLQTTIKDDDSTPTKWQSRHRVADLGSRLAPIRGDLSSAGDGRRAEDN